jgi:hypothetical protein
MHAFRAISIYITKFLCYDTDVSYKVFASIIRTKNVRPKYNDSLFIRYIGTNLIRPE